MTDAPPSDSASRARPGSLAGHSVTYLVGTALQGLGVLLVLPFATRLLGPVEYGKVATALVVVQMVGTIAAAGLPQVILREYHRGEDGPTAGRALAGTMALLALALAAAGLVLGAVLAATGLAEFGQWALVVVASAALTTVVSGQTLSRARLRPLQFLLLAVASTVLAHLAGLLTAARVGRTASTYLTAYTVALLAAAVLAVVVGRPLLPTAARQRVRAGIRLAAPLLPQAVALLGLLMGDVLLAGHLLGDAAAGSYQVALQLGNMPFVLAVALFNAWGPLVLSHPRDQRWQWTARTGAALTTVVAVGAGGVALLGPWLVSLMSPAGFSHESMWSALGAITVVATAYMVYQGASLAVLDHEHTERLAVAAAIALVVLVAVAWWLASPAGVAGVAVAKAVAYLVLMALTLHAAHSTSPLRWPRRLWVVVATAVALGVAGALLPGTGSGAAIRIVLVIALVGAAAVLTPRVLRTLRG